VPALKVVRTRARSFDIVGQIKIRGKSPASVFTYKSTAWGFYASIFLGLPLEILRLIECLYFSLGGAKTFFIIFITFKLFCTTVEDYE
jgi:hypothetical protein